MCLLAVRASSVTSSLLLWGVRVLLVVGAGVLVWGWVWCRVVVCGWPWGVCELDSGCEHLVVSLLGFCCSALIPNVVSVLVVGVWW